METSRTAKTAEQLHPTPCGILGTITWAINVSARHFTKVKANTYVPYGQFNRQPLIDYVNTMTKPYIVASPKDLMDMNLLTNNKANRCHLTQTKKMIWCVDYNKNKNTLSLMPLR